MLKQNDIAMIIVVVTISFIVSFFVVGSLVNSQARSTSVPAVNILQDSWPEVDKDIFNDDAVNPTVEIKIGDGSSGEPFQNSSN